MNFGIQSGADLKSNVSVRTGFETSVKHENYWRILCWKPDGTLAWECEQPNLVTRQGVGDSLTQHLKGAAYTAAWFVGLCNTGAVFATTDTHALHAGWTETTIYDETTRPALTFGTTDISTNTASLATSAVSVFTMNANGTLAGGFITNRNVKGDTGAFIIYGEVAFAGGDKPVAPGYVINVSVTCTSLAA